MAIQESGFVKVASVAELMAKGSIVVTAGDRSITLFHHHDRFYALDSRCPHMGFPLQRGTVCDGILTCHWHHARFDLASGGTFDPFADDVRTFPVKVVDGHLWVDPSPLARDERRHWSERLKVGLEQEIPLVIAKSVLGLQAAGDDYRTPVRLGAHFGTRYTAQGWGAALSILTCSARLQPHLSPADRPLALYQGLAHVARECNGKPPRFPLDPLPIEKTDPETLKRWFRHFIDMRDEEGAERILRTAIERGLPPLEIADMVFATTTDHVYLDGGHSLDFANKAFEILDQIGWEHAAAVLTSLVHGMAKAQRSEELSSWRQPLDIADLVKKARAELPALCRLGCGKQSTWDQEAELISVLLDEDPVASLTALKAAVSDGASSDSLGAALTYAASLRMAHFHCSNEFGDWERVHHSLTAANALHQALKRAPSTELLRGLFDAAMSIYLTRFLNLPLQRLPKTDNTPVDETALLNEILELMNQQQQVNPVAERVSAYLTGGGCPDRLMETLGHALLREDAGFHAFQVVEAAFQQFRDRREEPAGRHILIAMSRYLAAHSPTPRASGQTFRIALRLQRGEAIHLSER